MTFAVMKFEVYCAENVGGEEMVSKSGREENRLA